MTDAVFCRECGASDDSGWGDFGEEEFATDEDFDYEDFVEREFGTSRPRSHSERIWQAATVAILVVVSIAIAMLTMFGG
jgi:hypothetical protein